MTSQRLAAVAGVGALLAWGFKATAIWIAGGLDESPLEGPLFFTGLVLLFVAFGALGVSTVRGRSGAVRLAGGIAGLVAGVAVFFVVETGVGEAVPESAGWVREEAGLWAMAALTAAVAVAWLAYANRREPTRT